MSVARTAQTTTKPQDSGGSAVLLQRKCACGGAAGLTGECEGCRTKRLLGQPLQAKLRINEPGDAYEQEADRVADHVMWMRDEPADATSSPSADTSLVQRRLSAGNPTDIGTAPSTVDDVLSSPGHPLNAATRAFFEPRFGHHFGHVRVHHDAKAAESARAVNAFAYTVGRDIVFDVGRYAPGVSEGQRLLAHELAHSLQQRHGASASKTDRAADQNPLIGKPVRIALSSPVAIARQPLDVQQAAYPDPTVEPPLFETPDPNSATRDAIAALESIRFVEADRYILEAEGEIREFNELQFQALREKTDAALFGGINSLRARASHVQNIYLETLELNKDWRLTSPMEALGVERPGEELTAEFVLAKINVDEAEEALAAKRGALAAKKFSIALEKLVSSEEALVKAEQIVDAYRLQLNSTAETIKQGAVITRNVSVGVLIGIGAVVAAPVVAGASATTLTTLGAGATVVGGGAAAGGLVEGGVNVVEQALEGEGFDWSEFGTKTYPGVILGATAAGSGVATAGMASLLGQGTTLGGQVLRSGVSGYAGGASGGGLRAALEGKSPWEIAKAYQLGGFEGLIGGGVGGATSHLMQGRSLLARVAIETLGGGSSSGLGAAATGKSPEEIAQSVFTGAIAGGAVEFGIPKGPDSHGGDAATMRIEANPPRRSRAEVVKDLEETERELVNSKRVSSDLIIEELDVVVQRRHPRARRTGSQKTSTLKKHLERIAQRRPQAQELLRELEDLQRRRRNLLRELSEADSFSSGRLESLQTRLPE